MMTLLKHYSQAIESDEPHPIPTYESVIISGILFLYPIMTLTCLQLTKFNVSDSLHST